MALFATYRPMCKITLLYTMQGTIKPLANLAGFAFVPYSLNHMFVLKLALIV